MTSASDKESEPAPADPHAPVHAHLEHHLRVPAWLRRTQGEHRWPVALTIMIAILLQLRLPEYQLLRPAW